MVSRGWLSQRNGFQADAVERVVNPTIDDIRAALRVGLGMCVSELRE